MTHARGRAASGKRRIIVAVHGVLVDLLDDAEGYVPLEVDYLPASAGQPMEYRILKRHGELASHVRGVALARGVDLAAHLGLVYIGHHL